jgi:hypothetical protein
VELKEVFHRVSEVLQTTAVPYMLTGSFAGSYYGVLRATQDIDIVIEATPHQVRNLVEHLQKSDYYADQQNALNACQEQSMFNAVDNKTGWKIDLIFRKPTAYAREAFERRRAVEFHQARMFVASPEDVILSKLEWAKMGESHRQLEDAAALVKKQVRGLDFAYIERWVKELRVSEQWELARKSAGLE